MGALVGLYLGWAQFPVESRNRSLSSLARLHRDEYSVMVAAGYAADRDAFAAIQRLERLGVADVSSHLRETTERIIATSSRDIRDIALLAQLADALGQATDAMQPFINAGPERA